MHEDLSEYSDLLKDFEDVEEYQECNKCLQMKPIKEFPKRYDCSSGSYKYCSECKKQQQLESYKKNRPHHLKRMKEYNEKVKKRVIRKGNRKTTVPREEITRVVNEHKEITKQKK